MKYSIIFAVLLLFSAADIQAEQEGALQTMPETADTTGLAVPDRAPKIAEDMIDPVVKAVSIKSRVPKKSIKKAFFMSLILPGAGEYYVGEKKYAKVFLGTEALIWSFALFSKFQGEMWRTDYRNYAAQYAGANSDRTEDIYYQNIYEYASSDWYNVDIWAEARMIYPDDPASQEAYVADKLYGTEDDWAWQSMSDWYQYRGLRVKSQEALHRISYSNGAAILNHLLSAVNAARLAKKQNRLRLRAGLHEDWQLRFLSGGKYDFGLALNKNF